MKKSILIELIIWLIALGVVFGLGYYKYHKKYIAPYLYVIEFKDIDGITKGSPVRFMGINIGHVRALKSKDKHVNVQIIVTNKSVKIPDGTMAEVEFFGLGGSKSIELMPPDDSCTVGISSSETIRLASVAKETKSIVELIEMLEKYIKGINQKRVQNFLKEVKSIKDDKIKTVGEEFDSIEMNIENKFETVKLKQQEANAKVQKINENVEKINKFIKK